MNASINGVLIIAGIHLSRPTEIFQVATGADKIKYSPLQQFTMPESGQIINEDSL